MLAPSKNTISQTEWFLSEGREEEELKLGQRLINLLRTLYLAIADQLVGQDPYNALPTHIYPSTFCSCSRRSISRWKNF